MTSPKIIVPHAVALRWFGLAQRSVVKICHAIEVVNLARQINSEVDSDDIQELLDYRNDELTIDKPLKMHRQE
ncbi:hypothetical protein TNCV_985411 [Trichonephila clavipes]|nr:hypothetical protein TNCV_985411 [Trichonephila clavipes]